MSMWITGENCVAGIYWQSPLTDAILSFEKRYSGRRQASFHTTLSNIFKVEIMLRKKVSDSLTEQVYIVRSQHINGYGRLFGGILMQWIDELAGIVTRRHCGTTVTTAAIDNLRFEAPAFQDDMVVLIGRLTYVGTTSMEVRIDVYVEDPDGIRRTINRAYVVMVAISEEGKPLPVPGLIIESENERYEWQSGEKRYRLRKTRREEGF